MDLGLFTTHKPKCIQYQAGDSGYKVLLSLIPLCPCVVNSASPLAKGRKMVVTFLCVAYLFMVGIPPAHLLMPPQENTSAIVCSSGGRMNDNHGPIRCLSVFTVFLNMLCS